MQKKLSFIHLSDIHFNKNSSDPYDLDKDLRDGILRDIENNSKEAIGKPDGILICGDIAFSGQCVEYKNALSFLNEMCEILGISETSVLSVPGNHDVDQSITKSSIYLCDLHSIIENASNIEDKLAQYLRDPAGNTNFFKHIHEYNKEIGIRFGTDISAEKPTWNKQFRLNDNSILCIHGLNSTIISSHHDTNERLMVLGEYQVPPKETGVTRLTLCHHPPECWIDHGDILKTRLNSRVHVQLYGHKHIQKIQKVDNTLIIGSGAAHPVRHESEWIPRYNWLTLYITGDGDNRILSVNIYPRVLKDNRDGFEADYINCNNRDHCTYQLNLDPWIGDIDNKKISLRDNYICNNEVITKEEAAFDKLDNPIRTFVYRFLELPFITRLKIISDYKLLDEEDENTAHINLIDKIINKAVDSNYINEILNKINKNFYR